jgi:hypothetical protein
LVVRLRCGGSPNIESPTENGRGSMSTAAVLTANDRIKNKNAFGCLTELAFYSDYYYSTIGKRLLAEWQRDKSSKRQTPRHGRAVSWTDSRGDDSRFVRLSLWTYIKFLPRSRLVLVVEIIYIINFVFTMLPYIISSSIWPHLREFIICCCVCIDSSKCVSNRETLYTTIIVCVQFFFHPSLFSYFVGSWCVVIFCNSRLILSLSLLQCRPLFITDHFRRFEFEMPVIIPKCLFLGFLAK